jgi:hypothetical protein
MTTGKVDTKESDNYLTERQQQVKRGVDAKVSLHRSCVMILTTHLFLCVSRPPHAP